MTVINNMYFLHIIFYFIIISEGDDIIMFNCVSNIYEGIIKAKFTFPNHQDEAPVPEAERTHIEFTILLETGKEIGIKVSKTPEMYSLNEGNRLLIEEHIFMGKEGYSSIELKALKKVFGEFYGYMNSDYLYNYRILGKTEKISATFSRKRRR